MQSRFLTLSFFRSQLIFDTVPAYAVIRADPPLPEEIDLTLYFCYTQLYPIPPCNLLRRLGVNNSYVGFRYTVYGVIRAIANPELLIYISKGLYVEISAEYHTSIGCVERNIRTIISTIWLHGDRQLLNQVFGFELEQKPRNGAFIDALSHYVVEHYYD